MRNFFVTDNMYFRIIISLLSVMSLMFFCIVRLVKIPFETYQKADLNGYTVEINDGRGNIYDCNGKKITGDKTFYYVVFLPCENAIEKYSQITYGEERKEGLKKLKDKKAVFIKSEKEILGSGIYSYKSAERYSADLGLEHIVGYTDSNFKGIYGLEKAYNSILSANGCTELYFQTSASGDFLLGTEPKVTKQKSKGDLYLTIDKNIQKICNNAAEMLKMGAILVTESSTGKIRGMVSKPGFDINNLNAYVSSKEAPFLNRVLNAYSVGSVFKPLIAAAMLETSKADFTCNCVGYSDILGIRFYCNNRNGHGVMNLNNAIVNSCNTYFYNAAAKVEPDVFAELSAVLGFGKKIKIADNISSVGGNFTSLSELEKSKANVANFSIGQGNIALSPLALCNLYSAIANGGYYYTPELVDGYTENGSYYKTQKQSKKYVFSETTAYALKEYLINTVETGTGKNAKPEVGGAGGKTATAQTGRYSNKKEILNAWFCGFYPAKVPKYVIIILSEQAESGSVDSAPIFKEITEQIGMLK